MLKSRFPIFFWLLPVLYFCISGVGNAQTSLKPGKAISGHEDPHGQWRSLFNGADLSGWTPGRPGWSVEKGVLRNSRGQDADGIQSGVSLPSGEFSVEIRVKVLDGSRFRMHFTSDFWCGNEGYIRQLGLYGNDLTDITQASDQTYISGQWYTLRVVVDADNLVSFYKNDTLCCTAKRKTSRPSHITLHAGDGFSEGHIEISSIRVSDKALRPLPRVLSSTVLTDNFTSGPLAGLWQIKTNGAYVGKKRNELTFLPPRTQDSFAVMLSREGALPAGSSWKVETRFRFPHHGPYGIGLGICDAQNLEKRPLWIQFDGDLKQPHVQMGDKEVVLSSPDAWHTLLVINDKGHWNVVLDSKPILSGDFPQTDYTLYFGNDAVGFKSWDWTTLSLQWVRIEYIEGPKPDWIASL